jgi:hypothetical protein
MLVVSIRIKTMSVKVKAARTVVGVPPGVGAQNVNLSLQKPLAMTIYQKSDYTL